MRAASAHGRALAGAVLLDLAVAPLFAWNVFTDSLHRDLGAR